MKAIDYTQLYLMLWLAAGGLFHILTKIGKYKATKEKTKGKWSLKIWWRENFITTLIGALAAVITFGLTTYLGIGYNPITAFALGFSIDSAANNLLAFLGKR